MTEQRWYCGGRNLTDGPQVPVQIEDLLHRERRTEGRFTLPAALVQLAGSEYELHFSQTFERLNERGGLGLLEIVCLLADRVERLERKASK